MAYLKVANSFGMWIACSIIVLIVIWQAYIFMHNAYSTGKDMGLTEDQLKSALRCGTISTIGPALAVVVAMISLIINLGAPFAWMRLSVVGSIPYELLIEIFKYELLLIGKRFCRLILINMLNPVEKLLVKNYFILICRKLR